MCLLFLICEQLLCVLRLHQCVHFLHCKSQDEDVFKTCLEFWSHFTKELYNAEAAFKTTAYGTSGSAFGGVQGSSLRGGKQALYEGILHNLRILMIDNMAKPEVQFPLVFDLHHFQCSCDRHRPFRSSTTLFLTRVSPCLSHVLFLIILHVIHRR